jgi:hypothetical protein
MTTTTTPIMTKTTRGRKEKETTSPHLGRNGHRSGSLVRIVRRLVRNVVIPGKFFPSSIFQFLPLFSFSLPIPILLLTLKPHAPDHLPQHTLPPCFRRLPKVWLKLSLGESILIFRPCERCVKYGLPDCIDSMRKPRKTGVKRYVLYPHSLVLYLFLSPSSAPISLTSFFKSLISENWWDWSTQSCKQ